MALSLAQLRKILQDNRLDLFSRLHPSVIGLGIGPATANVPTAIQLVTTGENSIVIVASGTPAELGQLPASLSTTDGGQTITAPTSIVPGGVFDTGSQSLRHVRAKPLTNRVVIAASSLFTEDDNERDELLGGVVIRISQKLDGDEETQHGTLGCIARLTDSGKIVALTCHHVVLSPTQITQQFGPPDPHSEQISGDFRLVSRSGVFTLQRREDAQHAYADVVASYNAGSNDDRAENYRIGHPTSGNCSWCRDIFGRYEKSTYTSKVDAAAILLFDPTHECDFIFGCGDVSDWRAEVLGPNGSDDAGQTKVITGQLQTDIGLEELQSPDGGGHRLSYVVRKYGSVSGYGSGLVRCIDYTMNPAFMTDNPQTDPLSVGVEDYLYVIPYDESTAQVGKFFAVQGDSGAPAVTTGGLVVGLVAEGVHRLDVTTGTPKEGFGGAVCKISNISAALGVEVIPFSAATPVRTVPVGNYRDPLSADGTPPAENAIAAKLGPRTRDLMQKHGPEIRRLGRRNRRILLAWHQNGGPSLAWSVIRGLRDSTVPIPATIAGRPAHECVNGFLDALADESSEEVRKDIDMIRPFVRDLEGLSVSHALKQLEQVLSARA